MFLNCSAGENAWESLGQQGGQTSPVHPKGNQPWIFIGRTDAGDEAPILWPPDAKNLLIGKDLDAGKDWRQEKGAIENEMVRKHHQLNRHEFEQTLGDGEGQRSLVCCSPWGRKESDMTWQLNNNNKSFALLTLIWHLFPRDLDRYKKDVNQVMKFYTLIPLPSLLFLVFYIMYWTI